MERMNPLREENRNEESSNNEIYPPQPTHALESCIEARGGQLISTLA